MTDAVFIRERSAFGSLSGEEVVADDETEENAEVVAEEEAEADDGAGLDEVAEEEVAVEVELCEEGGAELRLSGESVAEEREVNGVGPFCANDLSCRSADATDTVPTMMMVRISVCRICRLKGIKFCRYCIHYHSS